jgi:hypothetical protein
MYPYFDIGLHGLMVLRANLAWGKHLKKPGKIKDLQAGNWTVLSLYRSGSLQEGTPWVGRPTVLLYSDEEDLFDDNGH